MRGRTRRILPLAPLLLGAALIQCHGEGIRLPVDLVHHHREDPDGRHPPAQPDGVPRRFRTDRGFQITLTRAYLTIGSVEIVPCSGPRALLLRLGGLVVGRAQAHTPGSPTRIGTPHVANLLRADLAPLPLGVLSPPPGSYCQVRVALSQADADAEGLPRDVDMVGRTLHLAGRYVAPAGGDAQDFVLEVRVNRARVLDLGDRGGQPAPLVLDGAGQGAALHIGVAYDGWLDGVDLDADAAAERERKIVDNVLRSLRAHGSDGVGDPRRRGSWLRRRPEMRRASCRSHGGLRTRGLGECPKAIPSSSCGGHVHGPAPQRRLGSSPCPLARCRWLRARRPATMA